MKTTKPSLTTKGYDHKPPIRTSFDQRFNRRRFPRASRKEAPHLCSTLESNRRLAERSAHLAARAELAVDQVADGVMHRQPHSTNGETPSLSCNTQHHGRQPIWQVAQRTSPPEQNWPSTRWQMASCIGSHTAQRKATHLADRPAHFAARVELARVELASTMWQMASCTRHSGGHQEWKMVFSAPRRQSRTGHRPCGGWRHASEATQHNGQH